MRRTLFALAFPCVLLVAAATPAQFPDMIYYKFDEASGLNGATANHAIPGVGNPNPIAMNHTLAPGGGQFNGSLVAAPTAVATNGIDTGWQTSFGTGSWTISFWADVSFAPTGSLYYAFGDSTAGTFRCFYNGVAGVGNVMVRGTGITDTIIPGAGVGGPHAVTFVYDSTIPAIIGYLDGVQVVSVPQGAPNIVGTGNLRAAGYTASSWFNGVVMDEFRVYSYALTPGEVATTWNLDMYPTGLFPNFTASPSSGPASLTVNFSDASFTSDPGGILTWAWDVDDDGIDDYFVPNPVHAYQCPGSYTVRLTVTDGSHPAQTAVKQNFINVGEFLLSLSTTGGGVGDLTLAPVPTGCGAAAGSVSGWTLVSLTTAQPAGTGPGFGLVPDPVTFQFLFSPPNVGTIPHFIVAPGAYPDTGPVLFPPGFFSALAGFSLDAVMVFLAPGGGLQHWSNVARVTF